MSGTGENTEDRGGDEALAAEYVLGVLASDERGQVAERLDRDQAFAALVDRWEGHFAPLAAGYEEASPPAGVKAALDRRLFASAARGQAGMPVGRAGLWKSLTFWRGLSAAATAGLAFSVGVSVFAPFGAEAPRKVASLQGAGSDVHYVALYDEARHQVALSHLSGETGSDRDFELWMIEGDKAPVSMGVIPSGSTIRIRLSLEAQRKLAAGGVLAISLEPSGGSPTGQPTGPVVASGSLRDI